MNINRILGIFISVTISIWILVFALSPQPKYQQIININIPELPEPEVDQGNFKSIEFKKVQNDSFKVDVKDTLPSAKELTNNADFNFYVYKIGAFKNQNTISRLVKSYNDEGFPAFTEQNQSNKDLTNILVGPFARKSDIEENKQKLNYIAENNVGEVIAWSP
tara:strand:- start:573 stop:1061 length:489 start_codon:yes stop_codon:yes gene_type:complete